MNPPIRIYLKLGISIFFLAVLFYFIPDNFIQQLPDNIRPQSFVFPFFCMFLQLLISSCRYNYLTRRFDLSDNLAENHRTNIYSLVYSLFFIPLLAQMVGRVKHGHPPQEKSHLIVPLTIMEKGISLLTLCAIALCGAIYTFGTFSASKVFLISLLILISFGILCAGIGFIFILKPVHREAISSSIRQVLQIGLPRLIFLSFLIHLCSLAAYVMLGLIFFPDVSPLLLAAGFSLVILASALPISFLGWGIREMSAAAIFTLLGYSIAPAVSVSIIVGVLYLCALGVHFLIVLFMRTPAVLCNLAAITNKSSLAQRKNHFWILGGFLLSVLMPFQFRLPTHSASMTFNLADPFAFVIGLSFFVFYFMRHELMRMWKHPLFVPALFSAILMLVVGWTIGYARFGSNDWATGNRMAGIILIGCYLMSGAMMGRFFDRDLRERLTRITAVGLCVSVLVQALSLQLFDPSIWHQFNWSLSINGFIFDRNAFSLFCLMALCLMFPLLRRKNVLSNPDLWIMGFLMFSVIYSGSRTGLITLCVLLAIQLVYKRFNPAYLLITTISLVMMTELWVLMAQLNMSLTGGRTIGDTFSVDKARLDTWIPAIHMWLGNPLFGGGLGSFIEQHPQIVHNTTLWILAEMGLFGLILFLPLPLVVAHNIFNKGWRSLSETKLSLFCTMSIFVFFSMAHDVIYQRYVWLILGMFMILPRGRLLPPTREIWKEKALPLLGYFKSIPKPIKVPEASSVPLV